MQFEDPPVPSHTADPKVEPGEQGSNGKGPDLEDPLELKPTSGQRGEGILWAPMVVMGIVFKGGHPPGSPCTAMPLQTKVHASS